MEKETLNDLFNNLPVYTKRKFEIITKEGDYYKIDQEKINEIARLLDNSDHKLIARCIECDDEYPFSYKPIFCTSVSSEIVKISIVLPVFIKNSKYIGLSNHISSCFFACDLW